MMAASRDTAGQPVVIALHCSAGSARQWRTLADALGPGARVLAPGLIDYPDGAAWQPGKPITLDDEAAHIERLLVHAGDALHIVGHSYGGAVAMRLAQRNPARVRSVTLYEPALFALLTGTPEAREARNEISAVAQAMKQAMYAGLHSHAARSFVDYWSGTGAWKALDARRQWAVIERMNKVCAEFDSAFGDAMTPGDCAQFDVDVTLLTGTHSPAPALRTAAVLSRALPRCSVHTIPGAGHMGPLTHADAVADAVVAVIERATRRHARNVAHAAPAWAYSSDPRIAMVAA